MTQPQGSPTAPTSARMRVGVVQASPAPQADYVWVLVDTALVQAAYFTDYVPVPGDRVVVTQQDSDWFCFGGKAGYAGNLVLNGDFSQGPHPQIVSSTPPYHWFVYTASGTAATTMRILDAERCLPGLGIFMGTAAAGDQYAYSAPIPVNAGETLYVDSVGVVALIPANPTVTLNLRVGWFADPDAVYPNFLSESVVDTDTYNAIATNPFWQSGSAVVPATARYARVAVRTTASGGSLRYNAGFFRIEMHRV